MGRKSVAGLLVALLLSVAGRALAQDAPAVEPPVFYASLPRQMLLTELEPLFNICYEEILPLNTQYLQHDPWPAGEVVRLPRNARPCRNAAGERLTYYAADGTPLAMPQYSALPTLVYERDTPTGYCLYDLTRDNPPLARYGFLPGMTLFIAPGAQRCEMHRATNETLYDLSRRFNVCMEAIQHANLSYWRHWRLSDSVAYLDIPIAIPVAAPPCYDAAGARIGHQDRAVYRPAPAENLFAIAQQHQVCINDLLAANPFIVVDALAAPAAVFIPAAPPCHETADVPHRVREGDTLYLLSLLYNVCYNRITDANPALAYARAADTGLLSQLRIGSTVIVPVQRPDCYYPGTRTMVDYVCYPQPVDLNADYRGQVPPLAPITGTDSGYCHPRSNTTPVIYNNEPLLVYRLRPLDTAITLGQCFGVKPEALLAANAITYPPEVRPAGWWVIPAPYHADCYLLTADVDTYRQVETAAQHRAGYLIDGVYTVNHQDTLSSLGRTFGYLPAEIARVNDLGDGHWIYYRQELRLPPYPSLYVLLPVVAVTLAVSTGVLLLRVLFRRYRAGRRKRKVELA
jgi:LysM repeat protein